MREGVRSLGPEVTSSGVRATEEKVNYLLQWNARHDTVECRRFIGMNIFYHRFLPGQATLFLSLHDLTNKPKRHFLWTAELETAFNEAKSAIAAASLLVYPLPDAVTQVTADASDEFCTMIQQFQAGQWVPLTHLSKTLSL